MAMPRRASVGRFGLVDASVGASGQTAIPLRGVLSPAYIHTYMMIMMMMMTELDEW